jgi:hypothetical protein
MAHLMISLSLFLFDEYLQKDVEELFNNSHHIKLLVPIAVISNKWNSWV